MINTADIATGHISVSSDEAEIKDADLKWLQSHELSKRYTLYTSKYIRMPMQLEKEGLCCLS